MSILKGFVSLFDWMFLPKSYEELSEDLDNKMQDLYDKNGWGEYVNPLKKDIRADDFSNQRISLLPHEKQST